MGVSVEKHKFVSPQGISWTVRKSREFENVVFTSELYIYLSIYIYII